MVIRTSPDEFGHCTECGYDFNNEELFEDELLECPQCDDPLYENDNEEHHIPEVSESNMISPFVSFLFGMTPEQAFAWLRKKD